MPACPTQAIIAPFVLDARRCISYLTIELRESIPEEYRAAIGNRIYGCDDCQLVCPWNKFAQAAAHPDFKIRHGLDAPRLVELATWTRPQFESRLEGNAIRRIGYDAFMRNVMVALGNGPPDEESIRLLRERCADDSELIAEHARWALERLLATHTVSAKTL
jgi:epoxyqueuosine reductase